jgi:hypothetical protein
MERACYTTIYYTVLSPIKYKSTLLQAIFKCVHFCRPAAYDRRHIEVIYPVLNPSYCKRRGRKWALRAGGAVQ